MLFARAWCGLAAVVSIIPPGLAAAASLSLGAPFTNDMVIQREQTIPIWGRAAPGAEVEVEFGETSKVGMSDADGNWRVELSARAAGSGLLLTVRSGNELVSLQRISVGDVFLCSGQSNMQMPMARAALSDGEATQQIDRNIRLLSVPVDLRPVSSSNLR